MTSMTMWVLIVAVILVVDALLVGFGYWVGQRRAAAQQPEPIDRDHLETELATLKAAMDGLDDCFATVDHAMRRVAPSMKPVASGDGSSRAYAIAHNLASKGASVRELMTDCGLTRGEASLIQNLNRGESRRFA